MMTRTIMSLAPLLVMAAVYAWFGVAMGKLFVQLGAASWKAWVPIVNQLEMLKLVNRPSSQIIIIAFVPLYGLYVYYQVLQEMTRLCGRDEKLALLGLLLPPVWAGKMTDGEANRPSARTTVGDPWPQPVGAMFGPTAQGRPAAVAPPAHATLGYPPYAAPAPVQPASGFADPFAPVGPAGPPPPAQPVAWPTGAAPTVSGPAWPGAPASPEQDAAPFYAASVYAAQVSADQGQPPQMPLQPVPVPPTLHPVDALVPAQPSPQPPAMAPPVMLRATPSLQPTPRPAQPSPPQAAPLVTPEAAPVPVQSLQPPPVMLPAAQSAPVRPSPQPTLHAAAAQAAPTEEHVEYTVVIDRTASQPWSLLLDDGRRFDLWAPSVLVGRAPSTADPGTQVLAISDETCTISKVHARLDLVDGMWQVTDAGSTNGIIVTRAGRAFMVPSGTSATVDEQLVLGSVGMRLASGAPPQQASA